MGLLVPVEGVVWCMELSGLGFVVCNSLSLLRLVLAKVEFVKMCSY